MKEDDLSTWRTRTAHSEFGNSYFAVAPGCPRSPHPTRWCKCVAFKARPEVEAHIAAQTDGASVGDVGASEASASRG